MTDNVINLRASTTLDLPMERVMASAAEENLTGAIVIGFRQNGEVYAASSYGDGRDILWLLEVCRRKMLAANADATP